MTESVMWNSKTLAGKIKPVRGRLAGKVAVVTGGARGIGKGIANRFAQEGATVLIADKDIDRAEETVREIGGFGGKAEAYCADVSRQEDAGQIIARSVDSFDGIDILVNNAGIIEFGSILDCTPEDWNKMIAVDLTGAFYCTQAAARQMIRQGRGGRLVHIGSTASLFPAPLQAAYSVAKAGLLMLSRVAALEFIQHGITSNLLCPHGAVTDMNRDLLKDPSVMAKLEDHIPAGRLASVEEIASAAAFLASDEAAYINGTELVHDGGSSISGLWWR
ncbi:MAG: glucose 1-dehydrogenase [Terracidiphilus sp.]|jgi:NAD(P)-dependent dehydrogenase (short-subunit alcohol dehydrogenase family)